jgi:hypothetical protein
MSPLYLSFGHGLGKTPFKACFLALTVTAIVEQQQQQAMKVG